MKFTEWIPLKPGLLPFPLDLRAMRCPWICEQVSASSSTATLTNGSGLCVATSKEDSDMGFENEVFVIEDGRVVGTTAVVDIENDKVIPTDGPRPNISSPFLEADSENLLQAGRATSFLIVVVREPNGNKKRIYGSASFLGPRHLVTACHNILYPRVESIQIAYPGLRTVDYFKVNTLNCRRVGPIPQAGCRLDPKDDITILECTTGHNASIYLDHETDCTIRPGDTIDVVAYPGEITENWIRNRPDSSEYKSATVLLPPRTLVVSRGTIERIENNLIFYTLSTNKGMSGGCVLHKGRVCGVHIGRYPNCPENTAVLLSHPEFSSLWRRLSMSEGSNDDSTADLEYLQSNKFNMARKCYCAIS